MSNLIHVIYKGEVKEINEVESFTEAIIWIIQNYPYAIYNKLGTWLGKDLIIIVNK